MKIRKSILAGTAAVVAAGVLTACSGSSGSSADTSGATPKDSASSSASAAGVQLPPDSAKGDLVAPMVIGYPPYAMLESGKPVGVDVDLADALSGPFGKTVKQRKDSFENALLGVNRGTYFGVFGADVTAEREKAFDQVAFLEDHYEFLSLKDSPALGTSMDALCGKKISMVAASSSVPVLKQQSADCVKAGKPAVDVKTFADQGAATLAVRSKQVDATTATVTNLGYVAKQSGDVFTLGGPRYLSVYIGVATKKGNGMAQAVADGLDALIKDGSYQKILERYGVEKAGVTKALVNPTPNPTH
ncbi:MULTISPECIES: transporter substrate-binding domain-containing protein [unclassified Streptomyces]|uniref:transporter substrate-binding domain-containing protein n=1 Tax=unclassified Streptomyces TaxID=2593676 RepID=UPI002E2A5C85|nr:transporter substrate-binding domain-containing protein [Streptomyces sp. NBC_00223]